ncbi:PEP-CTERM putative exosortase interaction domain-containing protein [Thraustotheca clavata]|uniref:PEP-CTERM putative exosortase interaction domain-containing protein n=1 Tax=Thraustotheca clavata TaxID=74557 RepID=A0A1W0AAC3_9STRA|nr:PEP-CTERM putative exosortase interaction domain-containing protein [Thraustotheca clavata]
MLALCSIALVLSVAADEHYSIKKIVNFGDSTSDVGNGAAVITKNNGPQIPSDAYYKGRFSNGPTYIENVAKELGAQLHSYSVGGATTSDALLQGWLGGKFGEPLRSNGDIIKVPGVDTQVKKYLSEPEPLDKNSILYTIWSGANDETDSKLQSSSLTASDFADAQYDLWVALAKAGAVNIMAVVPPPRSAFSLEYGLRMQTNAVVFSVEHWHVKFGLYELPALFAGLLLSPSHYGITHKLTEYCCESCFNGLPPTGNATICAKPDEYLAWDVVGHPTAHTHQIIAQDALKFIKAKY